ncbi:MAG TPA: thioredoxin family protein [Candidatus Nanoarchaeia archaeon]|nr:thioredoxin family protein [Candidatus Nanoarchaeia archaeon]
METSFVKKPAITIIVLLLVAGGIYYIESGKPDLSNIPTIVESELANKNTNSPAQNIQKDTEVLSEKSLSNISNSTKSSTSEVPKKEINELTQESAWPEPENKSEKDSKYKKAPDFAYIQNWINSKPLTIEQLKGKVVLIDFWTYSCINCIRTLPYLKSWDEKYRDKGLVIVGVHSPEFEFEKDYDNVVSAAEKHGLKYPIAQDNDYATWKLYKNRYWPREYLIDVDGYIVYDHIGEGNYETTEAKIQELLKERMERLNQKTSIDQKISKPEEAVYFDSSKISTPEIYLGYGTTRGHFGNTEGYSPDSKVDYKIPDKIEANDVYLKGKWQNNRDNMELVSSDGEITLKYGAKALNIVASSTGSIVEVYLNGNPVDETSKGSDVLITDGEPISAVGEPKLYNLVFAKDYGTGTLNLKIKGEGFKIYTFTFG